MSNFNRQKHRIVLKTTKNALFLIKVHKNDVF